MHKTFNYLYLYYSNSIFYTSQWVCTVTVTLGLIIKGRYFGNSEQTVEGADKYYQCKV